LSIGDAESGYPQLRGQRLLQARVPCQRKLVGGQGGIRTLDTVTRMPHFECGAFNHSTTCPYAEIHHFPGEINGTICEQIAASGEFAPLPRFERAVLHALCPARQEPASSAGPGRAGSISGLCWSGALDWHLAGRSPRGGQRSNGLGKSGGVLSMKCSQVDQMSAVRDFVIVSQHP